MIDHVLDHVEGLIPPGQFGEKSIKFYVAQESQRESGKND